MTRKLERRAPRAPLTSDRRTGGVHKTRRRELSRKVKHKGRRFEE